MISAGQEQIQWRPKGFMIMKNWYHTQSKFITSLLLIHDFFPQKRHSCWVRARMVTWRTSLKTVKHWSCLKAEVVNSYSVFNCTNNRKRYIYGSNLYVIIFCTNIAHVVPFSLHKVPKYENERLNDSRYYIVTIWQRMCCCVPPISLTGDQQHRIQHPVWI